MAKSEELVGSRCGPSAWLHVVVYQKSEIRLTVGGNHIFHFITPFVVSFNIYCSEIVPLHLLTSRPFSQIRCHRL